MIFENFSNRYSPLLVNASFAPEGRAGTSIASNITIDTLISHLEKEDVAAFNRDRTLIKGKIDLSGIQTLAGKNLIGVNFDGVVLNNANLSNCALDSATFVDAKCAATTFDGASAYKTDFTRAKLQRASFQKGRTRTELKEAIFCEANLSQSRLDSAVFTGANLYKAVFTNAVGLDVNFAATNLIEADMRLAWFDSKTTLKGAYVRDLKHSGFNCKERSLLEDSILNEDPTPGKFLTSAPKVVESKLIDGIPGTNREKYNSAYAELHKLIGLKPVKAEIEKLIASLQIEQLEIKQGLPEIKLNQHYAFYGPPGTGKTSVARIFGQFLNSLGYLEKGHLVEASRDDFVAGYKGQTAIKTRELVESAFGGVLLIDEAYSLFQGEEDTFGKEAVTTLLKLMEDNADNLVVIFCGYNKEMEKFIQSNPGLRSRVNCFIPFESYSTGELADMMKMRLNSAGRTYPPEYLAFVSMLSLIEKESLGLEFGNGRFIRNLFTETIQNQRSRIQKDRTNGFQPSKETLTQIALADLTPEVKLGISPESIDLSKLLWKGEEDTVPRAYTLAELASFSGGYPDLDSNSLKSLLQKS